MHDIELGINNKFENNLIDKTIIDIKDSFKYNSLINTNLFKLMINAAYIMIENPNIIEYYVHQETCIRLFHHYIIKYYLKHENNIFYKIERKYDIIHKNHIDKDNIQIYQELNEFIYYEKF